MFLFLSCFVSNNFYTTVAYANQQEVRNEVFDEYLRQNKDGLKRLRAMVAELAQKDAKRFAVLLSQHGIDGTFEYMQQHIDKRGDFGFRNTRNNTIFFTTVVPLFSDEPLPLLYYEYSYNIKTHIVKVVCQLPDYDIRESATIKDVHPADISTPILSGYRKRMLKPGDIKTALEYVFGMEISIHKEKIKGSSGYRITKVDQSGIFDFNGIETNDLLVGIGNHSLRDVKNLDELGAIINAVPVGSVTQFSVIRNGEKKIIPFKMYDPRECITE